MAPFAIFLVSNLPPRQVPGPGLQFPMFASSVPVSHSYRHLVDCGDPVEIFRLKIQSGGLLYADCHGVISIRHDIAAELPLATAKIRDHEQRIVDICQSPDFSPKKRPRAIHGSD
jgi:regulator of RNase E activity RraA